MSHWGQSHRDRENRREADRLQAASAASAAAAAASASPESASSPAASPSSSPSTLPPPLKPTVVQLDGLVLLKIINHSKESLPELVSGQMLGLDVGEKLEVTNCFPFPVGLNESDSDAYQLEMMRHMRTINVDNNTVGWYQAAYLGTFFDIGLLEAQYTYQKHIPNSVVVVYDPFQSAKGRLVLRAYRLSDEFMRVYAPASGSESKPKFSFEEFNRLGLDSTDIFQQVPIKVHNSHLVHGFLYELREEKAGAMEIAEVDRQWSSNLERLNLNYTQFLEKNLALLGSSIENYSNEQGKFQFFLRAQQRQKQQQADYLKKKAAENEARVAAGKDPLAEEDLSKNPLFKPLVKPNRLDTYLLSNQIGYYADSINSVANQTFQKLYLIEALQKKNAAPAAGEAAAAPAAQ